MERLIYLSTVTAAIATLLTGCVDAPSADTLRYFDATYGKVAYQEVTNDEDTWRVLDNTREGKLLVTPSIDTAISSGKAEGATLGLVETAPRQESFQRVAETFLKKRKCSVSDARKITRLDYEFTYTCP